MDEAEGVKDEGILGTILSENLILGNQKNKNKKNGMH